ncbi:MAG TPA: SRPBCC family protein, partial [Pseudonocardia sp.]|nr:SRPBCC family protein [Pseudonocardia sp.]
DGVFEVVDLGGGRSRFVWSELLDLPLGALGRLGWPLVRPVFAAGVQQSLRRMARLVEAGRWSA